VTSFADQNHFDPDPSSHFDADPDPTSFDADPDIDPVLYLSYVNPRVLAYSPPPLHFETLCLHCEHSGTPYLHCEPPKLLNFDSADLDPDPDHAIDFDADPDPTFITR
jgi:hypothetical protein